MNRTDGASRQGGRSGVDTTLRPRMVSATDHQGRVHDLEEGAMHREDDLSDAR